MKKSLQLYIVTTVISTIAIFVVLININIQPVKATSTLHDELYELVQNYETSGTIKFKGTSENIAPAINAAINKIEKNDPYTYMNLKKWAVSYTISKNEATLNFKFTYLTNQAKEKRVDQKSEEIIKKIIKPSMSEFEKVKAIHDYVVLNNSYSIKTSSSRYIAYTALFEKKGVCQAYATLMYKLFDTAGLETNIVVGHANGATHSWNQIKINNKWYHIDATFNDPKGNKTYLTYYEYFLVTDAEIKKTHTYTAKDYYKATSTTYAKYKNMNRAVTVNGVVYYIDKKTNNYKAFTIKTNSIKNATKSQYTAAVNKVK